MKTIRLTTAALAALAAGLLLAQETPAAPPMPQAIPTPPAIPVPSRPVRPPVPGMVYQAQVDPTTGLPVAKDKRFDLDFPGGKPADLIAFISKAHGTPVNAIIPEDVADTTLPAMNLKQVTLVELFQALEAASKKDVAVTTGGDFGRPSPYQGYTITHVNFGFRTTDQPPTDHSIWTFYYDRPVLPPLKPEAPPSHPQIVRFYRLAPYLGAGGYKVEDITTAVETGCQMLGSPAPKMKFHQETKLLIAVGDEQQLNTINQVLQQLQLGPAVPSSPPLLTPPAPVPQPRL